MFDFRKPMYSVRDPDVVKQLAVKDFDHFEDHRSFVDEKVDPMFGNSLISLKGSKWRDMRYGSDDIFTSYGRRNVY